MNGHGHGHGGVNGNAQDISSDKVSLLDRIDHLTWAWFTWPMATGGISLVIAAQPHTFSGLTVIGTIFFIADIIITLTLTALITVRFCRNPSALQRSLVNPKEALFSPAFGIAIFTILGGIQRYGVPNCGPWLIVVVRVLFWIYTAFSTVVMCIQYYVLFASQKLSNKIMTPALVLTVFPPMLVGTLASIMGPYQSPHDRIPILVAGVTMQGLGFLVSLLVNAAYLVRLLDSGLPPLPMRASMFIAVGPPAFTTTALIGIADAIPAGYGYFAAHPVAVDMMPPLALVFSVLIWTLGFWFLFMAILGCARSYRSMKFGLAWYAFVFPNSGLVLSIIALGNAFNSEGIKWVGSVATVVLVAVYFFVLGMNVRAVLQRRILWPGKDEDA